VTPDVIRSMGIDGDGQETLEAKGNTGYIFPLPDEGPPDDTLSSAQLIRYVNSNNKILHSYFMGKTCTV
jgi:hypothetical protein